MISTQHAPSFLNPRRFHSSSARWIHWFRVRSSVEYSVPGLSTMDKEDPKRRGPPYPVVTMLRAMVKHFL